MRILSALWGEFKRTSSGRGDIAASLFKFATDNLFAQLGCLVKVCTFSLPAIPACAPILSNMRQRTFATTHLVLMKLAPAGASHPTAPQSD